ncbi:hypothetical protein M087_4738 [Bacteroides fragilis str. S23 R14]|nr:hypothetical protein M087_4738 [Bacteroides fragilis str. S23 R14]
MPTLDVASLATRPSANLGFSTNLGWKGNMKVFSCKWIFL